MYKISWANAVSIVRDSDDNIGLIQIIVVKHHLFSLSEPTLSRYYFNIRANSDIKLRT